MELDRFKLIGSPKSRWQVLGLLAAATVLGYFDPQSLPVLIGGLTRSIPISDRQYSQLQFLILLSHSVMYAVGGHAARSA